MVAKPNNHSYNQIARLQKEQEILSQRVTQLENETKVNSLEINRRLDSLTDKFESSLKASDEFNEYLAKQNEKVLNEVLKTKQKVSDNVWKLILGLTGSGGLIYIIIQQFMG